MQNRESQFVIFEFCRRISIITAVLTIVTFAIALITPPLSGPFCKANCFHYPFSDITSRFPRDYYWMYFAIVLSLLYLIMMLAVHQATEFEKKIFSLVSVAFATMSAMVLSANYFVQVSVIQPSLLAGETDGISILSQYNPHGIFIVLEEMGFIFMIISFFALVPAFSIGNPLQKAIRLTAVISFCLTVILFLLISLIYGIQREYRFEVAVISIAWTELIILGFLFTQYFKKLTYSVNHKNIQE